MTTQKDNAAAAGSGQEQHGVASPNPTIDDSKSRAVEIPKGGLKSIKPAQSSTAAPMKSKPRRKPGRRRKD